MASANIIDLDNTSFANEISGDSGVVVVDFWAPWCMPCRMLAPTIESVAQKLSGKAKVCKVNVDNNHELSGRYGVQSIPTLIIFKSGQEEDRITGAVGESEILKRIEIHIA